MRIRAVRVNQWLPGWTEFRYSIKDRQRQPEPYFYIASLSAELLTRLSNIPRRGELDETGKRVARGPRVSDINIQRALTTERSQEIRRYVKGGYPWAALGQRERGRHAESLKPGLLPTAIVANVLAEGERRMALSLDPSDTITIEALEDGSFEVVIPPEAAERDWRPKGLYPINIIDGQHRLSAFAANMEGEQGELMPLGDFELPVVLFPNIDISWEAYLFWTINIRPKRISPSLAFDLYPLLRTQEWLEPLQGPRSYREARAQEMTEALWGHATSPWRDRISMLASERAKVSQASFVLSLTESYFRGVDAAHRKPGGLFASSLTADAGDLLGWTRGQQAAYLIHVWARLEAAVRATKVPWATYLRPGGNDELEDEEVDDLAFTGEFSLLAREMGVRGVLTVTNDISYVLASQAHLREWRRAAEQDALSTSEITDALTDLASQTEISRLVDRMVKLIADFDWRSSATPNLPEADRNRQALYRAGSGYTEVRRQLHIFLSRDARDPEIAKAAGNIVGAVWPKR